VCLRWLAGLSMVSLSSPLFFSLFYIENYKLGLFVIDISTLVIILLISNFFLDLFVKVLFDINLVIQF
jgi:hypothetical protein